MITLGSLGSLGSAPQLQIHHLMQWDFKDSFCISPISSEHIPKFLTFSWNDKTAHFTSNTRSALHRDAQKNKMKTQHFKLCQKFHRKKWLAVKLSKTKFSKHTKCMTISLSFRISPSFYTCPCGQSKILTQKLTTLLIFYFYYYFFISF